MRRTAPAHRPLAAAAWITLACNAAGPAGTSFAVTQPAVSTLPADDPGSSTASVPPDSSSTSTTAADAGTSGGTTLLLDVGTPDDLGPAGPPGCKGKIDFLFVISRLSVMDKVQQRVIDSFPEFIKTIEEKFADFDYHIMVVDGDAHWGFPTCTEDCTPEVCPFPDYPCDQLHELTQCDSTLGAGTIFNSGADAANKPCDLYGGNRYIIKGQPDLQETFACMAQVGRSGYAYLMNAMLAALGPQLNGPGGCNEGFLRDDALLFVTTISNSPDTGSEGHWKEWGPRVLDAKHGDPNAVVMFAIHPLEYEECITHYQGRICKMIDTFPYHAYVNAAVPNYGPAFAEAADLVAEACAAFIPG